MPGLCCDLEQPIPISQAVVLGALILACVATVVLGSSKKVEVLALGTGSV